MSRSRPRYFFEYYQADDGWRWRLKARNGKTVADGAEAYSSEAAVRRAIWNLNEGFIFAGRPLDMVRV